MRRSSTARDVGTRDLAEAPGALAKWASHDAVSGGPLLLCQRYLSTGSR